MCATAISKGIKKDYRVRLGRIVSANKISEINLTSYVYINRSKISLLEKTMHVRV